MSPTTATIILINLEDDLYILKKYKNLIHMKSAQIELIALSVWGKSKKYSKDIDKEINDKGKRSM